MEATTDYPLKFKTEELTLDNFEEILKKHTNRFNASRVMEEIFPREFKNEEQLMGVSNYFLYAKGNHDLTSLTKVPSEIFLCIY